MVFVITACTVVYTIAEGGYEDYNCVTVTTDCNVYNLDWIDDKRCNGDHP